MTAHPWLQETPWPTQQLPREELEDRIEHLLAAHWMCVLCTVGQNGPIGSPVEFYAEGLMIYILPQPGSPKVKAMQEDPRICVTVHADNCGIRRSVSRSTPRIPAGPVSGARRSSPGPRWWIREPRSTITS